MMTEDNGQVPGSDQDLNNPAYWLTGDEAEILFHALHDEAPRGMRDIHERVFPAVRDILRGRTDRLEAVEEEAQNLRILLRHSQFKSRIRSDSAPLFYDRWQQAEAQNQALRAVVDELMCWDPRGNDDFEWLQEQFQRVLDAFPERNNDEAL